MEKKEEPVKFEDRYETCPDCGTTKVKGEKCSMWLCPSRGKF